MNVHDFIRKQHRDVESAYAQFTIATGDKKKELGKQILTDLTVHIEIEEDIYYPELEKAGEKGIAEEHRAEHQSAKILIAKITVMLPESEAYAANMKALMDIIAHHIQEEESESIPKMETVLDTQVLEELGLKMEEHAKELKGSTLKRLWATIT